MYLGINPLIMNNGLAQIAKFRIWKERETAIFDFAFANSTLASIFWSR
jgi:hypothetical protein